MKTEEEIQNAAREALRNVEGDVCAAEFRKIVSVVDELLDRLGIGSVETRKIK